MGSVTIPALSLAHDDDGFRDLVITPERRLISSIQIDVPEMARLSQSMTLLNDPAQLERFKDVSMRNDLLKLHNIPVFRNRRVLREYIVYIFQTRVLVMYASKEESVWMGSIAKEQRRFNYQRIPLSEATREMKKIQHLAIRALYTLGLDYGSVVCSVAAGRKMGVRKIIPNPRLNQKIEQSYLQAIYDYTRLLTDQTQATDSIYLGADPEFVMQSPEGPLVIASDFFRANGKVGYDAIWIGENRTQKPVVELRPDPTPDPRQLFINICKNLLDCEKRVGHIPSKWLAGAMPYEGFSLGGHIHLSGIESNFKLLRAFDNYLALPFIIIEDVNGQKRRPKYGFLGDYREQDHGGFEYRTLPSWLVSPILTKGVFALAKIIARNYKMLRFDPLSEIKLQKAFYQGDKESLRHWFDLLWADLMQLDDYHQYAQILTDFYVYVVSGENWDETRDFRLDWKMRWKS